jgi:hypothetical protein
MRPRPRYQPTPYTSLTRTTSYPRIVLKVGTIRYSRRHRGHPLIYKTLHATERFCISPIRPSGASLRPARAMTSRAKPSTTAVTEMLRWEDETAIRSPPSRPTRRIIASALPESYGPNPQNRVKGGELSGIACVTSQWYHEDNRHNIRHTTDWSNIMKIGMRKPSIRRSISARTVTSFVAFCHGVPWCARDWW